MASLPAPLRPRRAHSSGCPEQLRLWRPSLSLRVHRRGPRWAGPQWRCFCPLASLLSPRGPLSSECWPPLLLGDLPALLPSPPGLSLSLSLSPALGRVLGSRGRPDGGDPGRPTGPGERGAAPKRRGRRPPRRGGATGPPPARVEGLRGSWSLTRQPAACERGAPNRTVATLKRGPSPALVPALLYSQYFLVVSTRDPMVLPHTRVPSVALAVACVPTRSSGTATNM